LDVILEFKMPCASGDLQMLPKQTMSIFVDSIRSRVYRVSF
jgi:hypothetical protein